MSLEILKLNEFELFGILPNYRINLDILATKYLELQQKYHPDNFQLHNGVTVNNLVQISAHINAAYATLKSPLLRSQALLRIYGDDLNMSVDIQLPIQFIELQMETHEALDLAKQKTNIEELEKIESTVKIQIEIITEQVAHGFDNQKLEDVKKYTKQLSFCMKLLNNINETIIQLM